MTEQTDNRQYRNYAMHLGTYMGIFWVLKFMLFPMGIERPMLMFLFLGLTCSVPFIGYHFTRSYRNKLLGGYIPFGQAFVFTLSLYFYAALLAAVAHYIYFQYLDHGHIVNAYEALITDSPLNEIPAYKVYLDQIQEAIGIFREQSAIDITMQMLTQNIFIGFVLSLLTAIGVRKSKPANQQ